MTDCTAIMWWMDVIGGIATFFSIVGATFSGYWWYSASRVPIPTKPISFSDFHGGEIDRPMLDEDQLSINQASVEAVMTVNEAIKGLAESSRQNACAAFWALITASALAVGFAANYAGRLAHDRPDWLNCEVQQTRAAHGAPNLRLA